MVGLRDHVAELGNPLRCSDAQGSEAMAVNEEQTAVARECHNSLSGTMVIMSAIDRMLLQSKLNSWEMHGAHKWTRC